MNWLWWYWPLALAFINFVLFLPFEIIAKKTGGPTFSRFMATVRASEWGPAFCFAWGLLIGGLVIHFSTACMWDVH